MSDARNILQACRNGNVDLVKLLIGDKCDIEARDKIDRRPIHLACDNGNVDIVKLLIEKKCDIEARDKFDRRPIHFACGNGHFDIFMLLIGEKCDIEARAENDKRPIHYGCDNGNADIVKLLIEKKCDIEACAENDKRPIHFACDYGHIDIVKLLIGEKCNIEARAENDKRPIHFACLNGNVDIVRLLIGEKCDIEACAEIDLRPIHFGFADGDVDIFNLLLTEECDIEARDKNDCRPIHIACLDGNIDIVKLLIEKKCDIEARAEIDLRPIHIACGNGNVDVVKLFITEKCNIEARDKNDCRPIHFACLNGHVDIAKLLIGEKCDIEAHNKFNKSPLSVAMEKNHEELIRILKYELVKKELPKKIEQVSKVECDTLCDHKSCPRNLIPTDSQNKEIIGRGALGKVYKLTDPENNFDYAVKSITIEEGDANEEVKSLEDNINKYRDIIKHRRIIEYFGSIKCSSEIHIFMEFVSMGSLHEKIRQEGSMSHQNIIRYAQQILEGLEFLHDKKVLHRDIKPQNILLDDTDSIKLCDFGVKKIFDLIYKQSEADSNNVERDTYCSALWYMAPEVLNGGGYRFPADIWSVGATIINLLTGQLPYLDIPSQAVISKIATTRKIEYQPREPMSNYMKLFMGEIFNSDPVKRATAKELLQFLNDHDMIGEGASTRNLQQLE